MEETEETRPTSCRLCPATYLAPSASICRPSVRIICPNLSSKSVFSMAHWPEPFRPTTTRSEPATIPLSHLVSSLQAKVGFSAFSGPPSFFLHPILPLSRGVSPGYPLPRVGRVFITKQNSRALIRSDRNLLRKLNQITSQ